MTLELTKSQKWLLLKALDVFTDDKNMMKFSKDYPDCDLHEMAEDLSGLIKKVGEVK